MVCERALGSFAPCEDGFLKAGSFRNIRPGGEPERA